jgi:MFS superfamily sulfate permease-like transporter
MILNFIMGFVFGITLSLILLLIVAWRTTQENRGNNSSTFDWDKGEYNEGSKDKKKI